MKAARILFCINPDTAIEYRWQDQQLIKHVHQSIQAHRLAQLLEQQPRATLLLLDQAELEFRTDSIPKISGSDLQYLLTRRRERMFPGSPYSSAHKLGVDPTDVEREQWLFHGLALPEALEPWLTLVRSSPSALAGISNYPLLAARALAETKNQPEHLLFVGASPGGWRLLYCRRSALMFSRLLPYHAAVNNESLGEEIERTRQYLVAQRWLANQEPLQVWLCGHPPAQHAKQSFANNKSHSSNRPNSPWGNFNLPHRASGLLRVTEWPLDKLLPNTSSALTRSPTSPPTGLHDWVAWLLLRHWSVENHYAPAELRGHYLGHHLRRQALALGLLALAAGTTSASFAWFETRQLQEQQQILSHQVNQLEQQTSLIRGQLPTTPIADAQLKPVAQGLRIADAERSPVRHFLAPIGAVLEQFSSVDLVQLRWQHGELSPPNTAASSNPKTPATLGDPAAPWVITLHLQLNETLSPTQSQQISAQLQQLFKQQGLQSNIQQAPFDFSSTTSLRAQVETSGARNNANTPLVLQLRWQPSATISTTNPNLQATP